MKEGKFPLSVSIGGGRGTRRWIVEDIEEYIRNGCVMSLGKPTANVPEVPTPVHNDLECRDIGDGKLSGDISETPISDLRHIMGGLESFGHLEYTTSLVSVPKRMKACLKFRTTASLPTIRYFWEGEGVINLSVHGLRRCELWSCPVCSKAKMFDLRCRLENRIRELRARNTNLYSMTFTIKHAENEKLELVYSDLILVWKKFIAHPLYKEFQRSYGLTLHFWVREIDYGDNGWHPHVHAIFEIVNFNSVVKQKLGEVWGNICCEVGRNVETQRGFHISSTEENPSFYLLKQWGSNQSNKPKGRFTPAQLGYSAYQDNNLQHRELYVEYLQFCVSYCRHRQFFLSQRGGGKLVTVPQVIEEVACSTIQLSLTNLKQIGRQGFMEFLRHQKFIPKRV